MDRTIPKIDKNAPNDRVFFRGRASHSISHRHTPACPCFAAQGWGSRMYVSFGQPDRVLFELLHVHVRQGDCSRILRQFDPEDLLRCEVGALYRKAVLEQGG
jgi:hypothetical protein